MIHGQRVRQLRVMHSMTQAELAARILIGQYQLSRLEKDQVACNAETEQMLAVELGVTADYLHRPSATSVEALSPQFRARSRISQRDRQAGVEWARLVDEEYTRLAEGAQTIPPKLSATPSERPAVAAHNVRELLGFTQEEPLPYLLLAVERLGVRVLGLPFALPTMDAFSAWHSETPIIGMLAGVPGDRARFTVAHELGHLVLHQPGQFGEHVEAEADEFAAELLTPRASIEKVLPRKPTLNNLTMVKTQWGVSIKALVRRSRELGVIDSDQAQRLYKQINKRGWNRKEPGFVPNEKPRGFRKLAELSYGEGPNVEKLASDAAWSHELTLRVLDEHATSDELPRKARRLPDSVDENVVYLHQRRTRSSERHDGRSASEV